jgi:hypothetical protein
VSSLVSVRMRGPSTDGVTAELNGTADAREEIAVS